MIQRECEDVRALQSKTAALYVFGHSFGGFVALEAACSLPAVRRVAVYEPGISIDGSIAMDWATACQRQLAQGRDLDAFITFVRGINPQTTGRAPRWLLRLLLPLLIKKPERQQKYSLLPTTIREHAEEARLDNTYAHYQEIAADILVVTGGQAGVTAQAVPTLAAALPQACVAHFPTLDHFGPEKKPKEIAECLTRFLLAPERESVGGGARRNKLAPSGPSRRT